MVHLFQSLHFLIVSLFNLHFERISPLLEPYLLTRKPLQPSFVLSILLSFPPPFSLIVRLFQSFQFLTAIPLLHFHLCGRARFPSISFPFYTSLFSHRLPFRPPLPFRLQFFSNPSKDSFPSLLYITTSDVSPGPNYSSSSSSSHHLTAEPAKPTVLSACARHGIESNQSSLKPILLISIEHGVQIEMDSNMNDEIHPIESIDGI